MGVVEFTQEHFERAKYLGLADPPRGEPNPQELLERMAKRYGVTTADILGRGKRKNVARARIALYAALRESPYEWSYPSIASFVGGRDPSTVIQGLRYAVDPAYRAAACEQALKTKNRRALRGL